LAFCGWQSLRVARNYQQAIRDGVADDTAEMNQRVLDACQLRGLSGQKVAKGDRVHHRLACRQVKRKERMEVVQLGQRE
jgi:hypothetical protein